MPSAKMPLEFQELVTVQLSDDERLSQKISPESMGMAISALHRDGVVVLANAVDVEHVDKLNSILSAEAEIMAKLQTTHFSENEVNGIPTGNMAQGPPLTPELMYTDIWANGPASAVLSGMLGPNPRIMFVNGNTARGGFHNGRQFVHADLASNHGQFCWGIVVNYYLTDASPANGSTELWLGSHRHTTFADHRNCVPNAGRPLGDRTGIKLELLEQRRQTAPPIQPTVKRGSVVLRDLRLWHAGISNPQPDPRIMLAFAYTPWWFQCPGKVVLPEAVSELVAQWASRKDNPVHINAHFVPTNLDHKKVKFSANFSSANKGYLSLLPDLPQGYIPEN